MAEKEERILINVLPPASGFGSCGGFYTEGVGEYCCIWNGKKEPITEAICNNCQHDKSMTRQEAIERMAKAIDKLGLDMDAIDSYICAESALNSLLEGK